MTTNLDLASWLQPVEQRRADLMPQYNAIVAKLKETTMLRQEAINEYVACLRTVAESTALTQSQVKDLCAAAWNNGQGNVAADQLLDFVIERTVGDMGRKPGPWRFYSNWNVDEVTGAAAYPTIWFSVGSDTVPEEFSDWLTKLANLFSCTERMSLSLYTPIGCFYGVLFNATTGVLDTSECDRGLPSTGPVMEVIAATKKMIIPN